MSLMLEEWNRNIKDYDNVFKIILPNLNVHAEQEKPNAVPPENNVEEDAVIALAQKQGTFTRKDVEKCWGLARQPVDAC